MKLKKILSVLLVAVTLMTVLPMTAISAFAEDSGTAEKNITLGTAALQGAQKSNVYFGIYQQTSLGNTAPDEGTEGVDWIKADNATKYGNGPYYKLEAIKWRVLSNGNGKLLLLSDTNLDMKQYNINNGYNGITWEECTLRSWLNGYGASSNNQSIDYTNDSFIGTAFSVAELKAVLTTALENADNGYNEMVPTVDGGNDTEDKVFLLSIEEMLNADYGFITDTVKDSNRISNQTNYTHGVGGANISAGNPCTYWLRSTGSEIMYAATVPTKGFINTTGDGVDVYSWGVRPALNVNLSSVLFTSAAKGGKSFGLSENADISTLTVSDGYKLTLLDESRSGFSAEILKTAANTYVSYKGAKTGENEYITAMIVNSDGKVTYYGSLKNVAETSEASGTVEIDLSGKMNDGDKLYILNEQYNGDCKTDYASALNEVTVPSNANAYNISFDANGGTGTMNAAVIKTSDELPQCAFVRSDYAFRGWSYTADGDTVVNLTKDGTLYAIWSSHSDLISALEKATADLETALATGGGELNDKITALTDALNEAKRALENADAESKTALEGKISNAQTALQEAVDKVAKELADAKSELEAKDAELAEKDGELQTFVTVVCVISCVSLCGSGAFVIWFFVDKKKKAK